jgi:hypothetical protein
VKGFTSVFEWRAKKFGRFRLGYQRNQRVVDHFFPKPVSWIGASLSDQHALAFVGRPSRACQTVLENRPTGPAVFSSSFIIRHLLIPSSLVGHSSFVIRA